MDSRDCVGIFQLRPSCSPVLSLVFISQTTHNRLGVCGPRSGRVELAWVLGEEESEERGAGGEAWDEDALIGGVVAKADGA
jgi:hypothetical protein